MMLTACALFAQLMVRPWSQTTEPVEARVAHDFEKTAHAEGFVHYAVPPMSDVQRLKDVYPYDGKAGGTVKIVMAKDEYEPGSFLLWGLRDLGKVQLAAGEFKNEKGDVLPAKALDLKFVKVWYQNKNAWYSYFADTGFKLCPELLLNDEDLIRVDEKKEANYARLTFDDGTVKERWLNPPRQMDRLFWNHYRGGHGFQPMRKEFCDAETLQPVAIPKGEFKQFFLTVHATKDTPAGRYTGEVTLSGRDGRRLGAVPVEIRVLDFALPSPKCYGDDDLDFYVASYEYNAIAMIMEENGGDYELGFRQLKAQLENHVSHNQNFNWVRQGISAESRRTVETMKAAGMQTDVLLGGLGCRLATDAEMKAAAERQMKAARAIYGGRDFYIGYGDEPPAKWLAEQRPLYKAYQEAGFKFIIAGSDNVFRRAGYIYDWHNIAKTPENDTTTRLWNQFGSSPHVAWYANQHVGVENPCFNRRQNGMAPYLAGYTALCNYAHHFGPYNDDSEGYKPMVLAYGHYRGVIDTLAWEGFREGVDDIRYATLAVKLARKAAKSKKTDVRYAGNLTLQYLASFDRERGDLDACRYELVSHILRMKALGTELGDK